MGFALNKVEGKREGDAKGAMQVTYSSEVRDVKEEEVPVYKDKVARINFNFNISYAKDKKEIGSISFSGSMLWKGDLEDIKKAWKDKKLPDKIKSPVLNYIYRKCLISGVGLSESLGLPTPVPMPRIEFKNQ